MDNKTEIIMEIGDTEAVEVDVSTVEEEVEEDIMEEKTHEMHLKSHVLDVTK